MATTEFIHAWERRVSWLHALLARLEARPRKLTVDLQVATVYRALWRQYRLRDAIQAREARDQCQRPNPAPCP